jgi:hypothetical protein
VALIIIAAIARNGAIGRDNALLCCLSEDLQFLPPLERARRAQGRGDMHLQAICLAPAGSPLPKDWVYGHQPCSVWPAYISGPLTSLVPIRYGTIRRTAMGDTMMRCGWCGGLVTWRGLLSALTHTQCEACGAVEFQVDASDANVEPGDADASDSEGA